MEKNATGNQLERLDQGYRQSELEPADIVARVNKIKAVLRDVMKDGLHYGKIEGCGDKPVLLKPGAETLGLLFRLAPSYSVEVVNLEGGHKEFRITCNLNHIPTGDFFGSGLGSCSTVETKYRFRTKKTGLAIPKEYWKTRNSDPPRASELLGGPQFSIRKIGKDWEIIEKIEHDNPADYYNTCLKIAKKRAHVDAIQSATGASDIFNPDADPDRAKHSRPGEDNGASDGIPW